MRQNYPECIRRVLLSEGGYTNNPRDPGGPTNWGITLHDARAYWKPNATAADVKAMPQSVAMGIYKPEYWDKVGGDDLPSGVDYAVFDYGVNSGTGRALLVLNLFHPETDPVALVHAICDERLRFLKSLPTWSTFGVGWERRVAAVRLYADHLASEADATAPTHPDAPTGSGKAYGPPEPLEPTQSATISPQPSPVVRLNDPPATPVAPQPRTHWWKPWAAIGLGGSGAADWLSQANDLASQVSVAKDNLEQLNVTHVLQWTLHNPAILLPAVAIACGVWLWEDHKKTQALIAALDAARLQELKKCSPPS